MAATHSISGIKTTDKMASIENFLTPPIAWNRFPIEIKMVASIFAISITFFELVAPILKKPNILLLF